MITEEDVLGNLGEIIQSLGTQIQLGLPLTPDDHLNALIAIRDLFLQLAAKPKAKNKVREKRIRERLGF